MARLIIFDDHVRGVDLPNSPVIIGRSRKSDVPIHDDILSRKHCALLPDGAGYRLVDLGSANGTFVNGERIEKADLSFDDIVEIGNTVLVFLDTEVWKPGEGLARLRHPVKAQELVHRLKAHVEREKRIPVKRVPRKKPASRRRRDLIQSMPELADSTLGAGEGRPRAQAGLVDLLVDYSVHRTIALLVRNHPRLRRMVTENVEAALVELLSGDTQELRPRLRRRVEQELRRGGQRPGNSEDGPATPAGEEPGATPGSTPPGGSADPAADAPGRP